MRNKRVYTFFVAIFMFSLFLPSCGNQVEIPDVNYQNESTANGYDLNEGAAEIRDGGLISNDDDYELIIGKLIKNDKVICEVDSPYCFGDTEYGAKCLDDGYCYIFFQGELYEIPEDEAKYADGDIRNLQELETIYKDATNARWQLWLGGAVFVAGSIVTFIGAAPLVIALGIIAVIAGIGLVISDVFEKDNRQEEYDRDLYYFKDIIKEYPNMPLW